MFNDLESHYQVQESKIINHPAYWQSVLMYAVLKNLLIGKK